MAVSPPISESQFTPLMHPEDDLLFALDYDDRDWSHRSIFSAYPLPEELMFAPDRDRSHSLMFTYSAYPPPEDDARAL